MRPALSPLVLLAPLLAAGACGTAPPPALHRVSPGPSDGSDPSSAQHAPSSPEHPALPKPGGTIIERKVFGGSEVNGGALALDGRGNRFVVGSFSGSAVFGDQPALVSAGAYDTYLVKLDPSNKPLWAKHFGGKGPDFGNDVVVDASGNVFISGAFESPTIDLGGGPLRCAGVHDLFVAKFDNDGKLLWAKRYGDAQDQIDIQLSTDRAGGVIATGWFNGTLDFGSGAVRGRWNKAFFAARIDAAGNGLWGAAFGHRLDYAGTDSAVDASGGVVVSGGSEGTPDFVTGGHPAKENDLGPVLVRLDAKGTTLSARRFGHGADNLGTAVAVDAEGGVRMVTASKGTTSFDGAEHSAPVSSATVVVTSFLPDGTVKWSRDVLTSSILSVAAAIVDAHGNTVIAGGFEAPVGGRAIGMRQHGFVIKLNEEGRVDWSLDVNEGTIAWMSGLAFDAAGHVVVAGTVGGTGPSRGNQLWLATIEP